MLTPNTPSTRNPGPCQGERGNLIYFYNQVYTEKIQHFAVQLVPAPGVSERFHLYSCTPLCYWSCYTDSINVSNFLPYAAPLLCRGTLLRCLRTPDSGNHLHRDEGCPAATPSMFHRTTQKHLPPVHPDSATTLIQAPQRWTQFWKLFQIIIYVLSIEDIRCAFSFVFSVNTLVELIYSCLYFALFY